MTTPSRKQKISLLQVLIPVAAIIVLAISSTLLLRERLNDEHYEGDGHTHEGQEISVGNPFPDLKFTRLDGSTTRLSEFKGKLLVLNLWATWCEACMVEMPSLQKLHEQLSKDGIEVWALSLDESYQSEVPPVVKKLGLTFEIFSDPNQQIGETLQTEMIPVTYIIEGSTRKLLAVEEGEKDWIDPGMVKKLRAYAGLDTAR
jgi:peroxiredoxin